MTTVGPQRFSVEASGAKPNDLPDGLDQVIVIGQAMDATLIEPRPRRCRGATGMGYSQDAVVLLIAQYLRNLGYQAVPSMNDTALAVPMQFRPAWENTESMALSSRPIRHECAVWEDFHRRSPRS